MAKTATKTQKKEFIEKIAPLIQKEAIARGYKVASPIIAQACVESQYGLSGLAKYHNYFGMKCGKSWQGQSVNMSTKEEYKPGTLTTIKDNFRVYNSMADGVKGYFDFVSTKRYANLKTAISAEEYLIMIKVDGYATSSTYVSSTMSVVKSMNLGIWDLWGSDLPAAEPSVLLIKGSVGCGVKWLQENLNRVGYKLEVDGIFGKLTLFAVQDFQQKHGLLCDGKVGEATKAALKIAAAET